ncbi:MAG TPA: S8 family serine peptidase [Dokdonella sp.]|uniref:S8 family serine peptidase n=1 Tax=Dokdonella sp. TaxID=2291710 RepID=UPI002C4D9792|nr:S8 family serine peptidase [Dokdonella sp.]HUD43380.1 S8 family serine peptidase [Dokdonella sp.]
MSARRTGYSRPLAAIAPPRRSRVDANAACPQRRNVAAAACLPLLLSGGIASAAARIDPRLAAEAEAGPAEALIELRAKASDLPLDPALTPLARRRLWVDLLRSTAAESQRDLVAWLDAQRIDHEAFWIANAVRVHADRATLESIAARPEVAAVQADRAVRSVPAQTAAAAGGARGVEWGVERVRAPLAWAAGIRGAGVVVAGADTGYQWDHPALRAAYRGWNGGSAVHDHHWYDGVRTPIGSGSGPCGAASPVPCDDHGHGTHTMGTMLGDDGGANAIGVAPDARWIACRNMDRGNGRPSTYIGCTQWFLAPTDLAGGDPQPDLAPDVVNNSWACPPSEDCIAPDVLLESVENAVRGGLFFVAAAGNSGPACQTIDAPPAIYAQSFVVGGSNEAGRLYVGSSRGPVPGLAEIKPDVIAPAESVRSSVPGDGYGRMTGTSMAAPHVAGAAALMISVNPALRGRPERIAAILRATAVPLTTSSQVCGGVAADLFPNPVQGYGQIDAWAAVRLADTPFADDFDTAP